MVDRMTLFALFRWPLFQFFLVVALMLGALYLFGDDAGQNMRETHMAEIAPILEKEKNLPAPVLIENGTYKKVYELVDNETGCAVYVTTEAKFGWGFTGMQAVRLPDTTVKNIPGDGIKRQIGKTYLATGEYTAGIWRKIQSNGVIEYSVVDESVIIGA